MTATHDYDLITLGAGSGGVRASRLAGGYGARVAIVEKSRVGGTCVMRGCIPKKLLVYGAHYADAFVDAAGFGWTIEGATLDWGTLIARKNAELDRLEGVYRSVLANNRVTLIEGTARLVDPHTVEVDGRRITAAKILIATGGWPVLPPIPGIELAITSNEALDLPATPPRIVIVGGGYIAVEFSGIFATLGAEVTQIIRAEQVLRGFDEDVRAALAEEMAKHGIDVRPHTRVTAIAPNGDGLRVALDDGSSVTADQVLYATGRAPNTRDIGLQVAGVALNDAGAVIVDDWNRTSVDSVFAVGDCTDRINLTPVAIAEGRAFAETHFNRNPMQVDYANVPSAVFSEPPVGCVGLSEAQARTRGPVDVYMARFKPLKHTLSGRDERTMVKLIVDATTDRVLGAHMVGADAPEIIQGVAIAVKCGATKAQFDATLAIHPTAAEEFVTMATKRPEPAPAASASA